MKAWKVTVISIVLVCFLVIVIYLVKFEYFCRRKPADSAEVTLQELLRMRRRGRIKKWDALPTTSQDQLATQVARTHDGSDVVLECSICPFCRVYNL